MYVDGLPRKRGRRMDMNGSKDRFEEVQDWRNKIRVSDPDIVRTMLW